jgi:hypothetical protein
MRPQFLTLTLLCLFLGLGCAQTNLEERVRSLEREADRQAVTRLMHRYAHGIDGMDESLLK